MKKRYGIFGNPGKIHADETIDHLVHLLSPEQCVLMKGLELQAGKHKVKTVSSALDLVKGCDTLFSLGGDGTMLTAARAIMRENPEVELIGVNFGRLGFIAEHTPELLDEIIAGLSNDTLLKENRLLLEGHLTSESNETTGVQIRRDILNPEREGERGDSARIVCLNEIVLDNYGSTRMLTFEVRVQGAHLGTLRADGLLVSTPTGSTGYSVSAGGPLVEPSSPVLIISTIAAHSLSARPVVVPEWYEIDIRVINESNSPILAVADGQEEIVIESPAVIKISGHQNRLKLLRHPGQSYFDLLRSKLLWSADVRGVRS